MLYLKKVRLTFFIFLLCFPLNHLLAGSTVIQDYRVTNLATTPVPGRGYSLSTNTFQSTCLQNIVMTQPSYDFFYVFQEMDSFLEENSSENNILKKHVPKSFRDYVIKRIYETEVKKGTNTTEKSATKIPRASWQQSTCILIMHPLMKVAPASAFPKWKRYSRFFY